jgi:hypothetical protein
MITKPNKDMIAKPKIDYGLRYLFYLITLSAMATAFTALVGGDTSRFADPSERVPLLIGMVFFAFLYYMLEDTSWKLAIGIGEIVIALLSNDHQLRSLANPATKGVPYDRLAFLVGGIIVLSKGVKDVVKGFEKLTKKKVALTAK